MRHELFDLIDQMLAAQQWKDLSPEVMLAFIRVTSVVKPKLKVWRQSLQSIEAELKARKLDTKELLAGLM
jgi:hypothetical protein